MSVWLYHSKDVNSLRVHDNDIWGDVPDFRAHKSHDAMNVSQKYTDLC